MVFFEIFIYSKMFKSQIYHWMNFDTLLSLCCSCHLYHIKTLWYKWHFIVKKTLPDNVINFSFNNHTYIKDQTYAICYSSFIPKVQIFLLLSFPFWQMLSSLFSISFRTGVLATNCLSFASFEDVFILFSFFFLKYFLIYLFGCIGS